MNNKFKIIQPFLRIAKFLLLIISCALLFADLSLMRETRNLAKSYSDHQNQATWFLFQLTKELSELVAESNHIGDGDQHMKKVWLKYDLAWSRFDLVLDSKEADNFLSNNQTKLFFSRLFEDYKALEPLLKEVTDLDVEKGETFNRAVNELYVSMIDFVNRNFRVASPLYQEQQRKANYLESLQWIFLIGFVFCICLISGTFYLEARHHKYIALSDSLTSLGNRLALFEAIDKLKLEQGKFTVYLLDMDGFKAINDKFGHQEGDKVLVAFAKYLNAITVPNCEAFRIGGDEFAIVQTFSNATLESTVVNYVRAPSQGNNYFKHSQLAVSVGVSHYPNDAEDIDDLLGIADMKMYEMKFSNKQDKQQRKKQV
ncbi:GGDEF domain-containing protein [Vibrio sp. 99-70-13A1]|uniref:GGDEF domain-containing protein n=1 Tax=Vibrio sp. 99-70-13A1 TaxID=2607601 RepID=UPI001493B557|nr:GGDEF domain-containing protein [Vibrio sp. 99-70-13A1]NOH97926.1 GGDEF domain-containing protein [Vibrio sp. 99-70-13A1]